MSSGFVIVKNNSRQDYNGRFDGTDYEIRAGDSVPMSVEAAFHCFGYGAKGKSKEDVVAYLISVGHRNGWHVKVDADGTATNLQSSAILKRFQEFDIRPAQLQAEKPAAPGKRGGAAADEDE